MPWPVTREDLSRLKTQIQKKAQSSRVAIVIQRKAPKDEQEEETISVHERQIRKGHRQVTGFLQAVFVTVLTDRFAWVALWFYAWNKDGGVSILPLCSPMLADLELSWQGYLGICLIPCYVMFLANFNALMAAQLKRSVANVCACFSLFFSPLSVTIMIFFYGIYLFFLLWLERCMMNCFPDDGPFSGPAPSCESNLWQKACPRHGSVACYTLLLKMYVRFRQTLYYITLTLIMIILFLIFAFVWSCHLRVLMHSKEELRFSQDDDNDPNRLRDRTWSRRTTGLPEDDAEPDRPRARTWSRRPTALTSSPDEDTEPNRPRTRTSSRRRTALPNEAEPKSARDRTSSRRTATKDRLPKNQPPSGSKRSARAGSPKLAPSSTRRAANRSPRRGSSPRRINMSPRHMHDKHASPRRLPRVRVRQPERPRQRGSSNGPQRANDLLNPNVLSSPTDTPTRVPSPASKYSL